MTYFFYSSSVCTRHSLSLPYSLFVISFFPSFYFWLQIYIYMQRIDREKIIVNYRFLFFYFFSIVGNLLCHMHPIAILCIIIGVYSCTPSPHHRYIYTQRDFSFYSIILYVLYSTKKFLSGKPDLNLKICVSSIFQSYFIIKDL